MSRLLRFTVLGALLIGAPAMAVAQTADPTPPPTFSLTVTQDNGGGIPGHITSDPLAFDAVCLAGCTKTFAPGTVVTLKVDANRGYSWDGDCKGGSGPCKVTLDADKTVKLILQAPHHTR